MTAKLAYICTACETPYHTEAKAAACFKNPIEHYQAGDILHDDNDHLYRIKELAENWRDVVVERFDSYKGWRPYEMNWMEFWCRMEPYPLEYAEQELAITRQKEANYADVVAQLKAIAQRGQDGGKQT